MWVYIKRCCCSAIPGGVKRADQRKLIVGSVGQKGGIRREEVQPRGLNYWRRKGNEQAVLAKMKAAEDKAPPSMMDLKKVWYGCGRSSLSLLCDGV